MTFRQWLHWLWLHIQGKNIEARIYALDCEKTRKCACPCGCQKDLNGLEDLCHFCLEYHEDLRKDFVITKNRRR